MQLISNTVAFIFAIGVIIFVHELGHLLVAQALGVRVHTFSLGFGKRLWGFRRGETDYQLSLVPLGGYVRLGGENPDEVSDDPRDFMNKPRWARVLVYLAGPVMNVLLAIVLVAVVFMAGVEVAALQGVEPIVGGIRPGSAAETAGFQPGDEIVLIDGSRPKTWDDVQFAAATHPAQELAVEVLRKGERLALTVVPDVVPKYEFGDAGFFPKLLPKVTQIVADGPAAAAGFLVGDQVRAVDGRPIVSGADFVETIEKSAGQSLTIEILRDEVIQELVVVPTEVDGVGRIQVGLGYFQRYGPVDALIASLRHNFDIARQTVAVFGKIFTGKLAAKSALAGPIEIAALSGQAARRGFVDLLYLMGLINISIAILNLLPIPVLDGGQIFILLIESLRRRDLSLKVKEAINMVGFVAIVLLMVVVLYFDVVNNLPDNLLPGS